MVKFKKLLLTLLLTTELFATYMYDDPTLGNLAIEAGIWNTTLSGDIKNTLSDVSFKNDLGYNDSENITTFGLDIKNDFMWIPNIYINYFYLKSSTYNRLNKDITISNDIFSNGNIVATTTQYSELNSIFYGYLQQSIFEFDLGINLKRVSFSQDLKEKPTGKNIYIKGPTSIVILPYIGLSIDLDFIDLVIKAEASILSIGDTQARDARYSLNYRIMRHMYISYGFKQHYWKSTSSIDEHEKHKVSLEGSYINVKILF